jgi:long-subunit acyl-CoA synthetase (AMP-forming)
MESATVPVPASVAAATIAEAFRITSRDYADEVALRTIGDEQTVTWSQWRERSDRIAAGLAGLGVGPGDAVALMIGNRPEFHMVDMAAVLLRATPFSIYQTSPPNQIQYMLGHAEARVAIVERQYLANVLEAQRDAPALDHLIVLDPEGDLDEGLVSLDEIERTGGEFDGDAAAAAAKPDDVLTLIYTSGTTGPPKGVEVNHGNVMSLMRASYEFTHVFPDGARVISWLPNAHVAERCAHHYAPIAYRWQVTCCPDGRQIANYLTTVHPQWFFSVPRIWEKLKASLETRIAGLPDDARAQATAALEASLDKVRREQRGEEVPQELAERVAQADREIFAQLRADIGLDQLAMAQAGAAPTPIEVLEFFHAIGIPLGELWGMSESTGTCTYNPLGSIRFGTVGKAVSALEIKVADDGELLIRGPIVMSRYRNDPEKTADVLGDDGWLQTGDIGDIDEDGYVRILDRKKELIINAAGKNMSPANIEATIKTASPLIGQACAIGDRRPYNTALVVLDPDFAPAWAAQEGVTGLSLADLARHERVRSAVQEGIDRANSKLSRVEQIKKFTIIPGDWQPAGDELTPTMKLKRKPIAEKYASEIEAMYG